MHWISGSIRAAAFIALLASPLFVRAESSDQGTVSPANPDGIEVFTKGQNPTKGFKLLSPISEKAKNDQDAFKKMKKTAAKMGADAIVEYSCEAVAKTSVYGGWGSAAPKMFAMATL